MAKTGSSYISISDLYLAYRKAKAEAFYENTHFHALAFAEYELHLNENLKVLHKRLSEPKAGWTSDVEWLGGYSYAPKSVDPGTQTDSDRVFYRFLDPMEDWQRQFQEQKSERFKASFRLVITPSINFQVVSALWIIKAGHKFDIALDTKKSFGNRLRRGSGLELTDFGPQQTLNLDCIGLFSPYFSAYAQWRNEGLEAMRKALEGGDRIVVVTMDLQRFYHRVSPKFLLRDSFLKATGITLDYEEKEFTKNLIAAIQNWYASTPDALERPEGAIPVGLSASKIIANVLLAEFDQKICSSVKPIYYGRYVDDIFLVVGLGESPLSGDDVMHRLADHLPHILKYKPKIPGEEGAGLRVSLPYARDSELLFTGSKQKVFNLSGSHGLDLVTQVAEQIRKHSSEHRLLPLLPEKAEEMASRALLAQPSASLEADALRKADAISVRRLGLSLLLRDVESYARDLRPSSWRDRRKEFYGLVQRHVVTPIGFFDFFSYIQRVFGLMIACGDFEDARSLIVQIVEVSSLLRDTTTAGTKEIHRFEKCLSFYAHALHQVGLQSSTVSKFPWNKLSVFTQVLKGLKSLDPELRVSTRTQSIKKISQILLHTDWGRRPFRDYWLNKGPAAVQNPRLPSSMLVRRIVFGIREFRKEAGLKVPYWPALAFPTRPLSLSEITLAAPKLVEDSKKTRSALFAFRGARTRHWDGIIVSKPSDLSGSPEFYIKDHGNPLVRVSVPSFLTTEEQWEAAVNGRPELTIQRYEKLRRIVNGMMKEVPQPHYVVFPECSIPFSWARSIAHKLATRKISLIAGLEYRTSSRGVHNDALVSLTTEWPWYASALQFLQPKTAPSHDEKKKLYEFGKRRLAKPTEEQMKLPVYVHGEFCFGVLICSDLTDISLRRKFQGAIDALFVLEWNQDTETFGFLVESAAQDLHTHVVQINNRLFGDSRLRAPRKMPFERDAIRIKGGHNDYFVAAQIDYSSLREFQRKPPGLKSDIFKPVPIGFRMSERRRLRK